MKNILILFTFMFAFLIEQTHTQQEKLIFVQEIFRHGARNPFQSMGIGDEYVDEENRKGELTKQGKSMHYLLGKTMKQVYWDKLFGNQSFNPNKFYIRSTNINRTIESAMAHLAGLLQHVDPLVITPDEVKFSSPPYPGAQAKTGYLFGSKLSHFQPLVIHTMQNSMNLCNSGEPLIRFMSYNCPLQAKWSKQNDNIPQYQAYLHDPLFLDMMNVLGDTIHKEVNLSTFSKFYDSLESMKYRGKKVPEIFVGNSDITRTLKLYFSLIQSIVFYGNRVQLVAGANDIVNETIQNMKKIVENPETAYKWILYSAHDITIGFFLHIFNMVSPKCIYQHFKSGNLTSTSCLFQFPPYASVLVFQLYSHQDGEPTFKVKYNGRYLSLPICNNKQFCSLSEFEEWYKSWKVQDVKKLCMSQQQMKQRMEQIQEQMKFELEHPGDIDYAYIQEVEEEYRVEFPTDQL